MLGAGADEVFAEIKVKAIKAWERTSRTLTRRPARAVERVLAETEADGDQGRDEP